MCIFCKIINNEIPSKKVYEDDDVLAILDLAQVTKGHTLVMPKKHFDSFLDVDKETLDKVINVTQDLSKKLEKELDAKGFNILSNVNEVSGQSVDHLHFHIIPRYSKDDAIVIENRESGIDINETAKELHID